MALPNSNCTTPYNCNVLRLADVSYRTDAVDRFAYRRRHLQSIRGGGQRGSRPEFLLLSVHLIPSPHLPHSFEDSRSLVLY